MESFTGYATRRKFYFKGVKLSGIAFYVRTDPYNAQEKDKMMTFWINSAQDQELFDKYHEVIEGMPETNEQIDGLTAYQFSGTYEMKEQYYNLKNFEVVRVTGQGAPSTIEQTFAKASQLQLPPVSIPAAQPPSPDTSPISWNYNVMEKTGWKDMLIARENVLNATVNFQGTAEERIAYMNRLIKWSITGQ
jgi:hypothetical protein